MAVNTKREKNLFTFQYTFKTLSIKKKERKKTFKAQNQFSYIFLLNKLLINLTSIYLIVITVRKTYSTERI